MSSKKVFKSIGGSTSFKLASSIISFFSVPLLLKALGTGQYALWVTMTALVAWLNLFDFGSGYSLKNKVAEADAKKEFGTLQPLIAGTIQFYLLMTLTILVCFACSLMFVSLFKTHLFLSLVIYLPIILSFPFTVGHFIIQGLRKFNYFNLILFTQSLIWLLVVLAFNQGYFSISIYKLAFSYSLLFSIANSLILFISLRNVPFNWASIFDFENFKISKGSLLVGSKFFILQLSSLFLYSLGNILTYNHLTLINVAQYDTVNKIYLMGMTIFNVIISVYWTEISHEKALGNRDKLLKLYNQLMLLSAMFGVCCLLVTFIMPTLIKFWTKNILNVRLAQLYPFVILVIIQAFAYSGAVFLNAFEQLKGQIIFSFLAAILIIPVATLLFKINFGIGTVPLAAAILTMPTLIYVVVKSNKIIKQLPT